MEDKSQDIELSQNQKSRLLSLGLGSKPRDLRIDAGEQKMDMLYDVLTSTLPAEPAVVDSLPDVIRDISSGLRSLAGRPIGDLLQDQTTDITTTIKIKQYAKDSGVSTGSESKREVFLVVYYAAIASALVYKHEKITLHSCKDLEQFFLSFVKKPWVLGEIRDLLDRAQTRCRRMKDVVGGSEERD